MTTAERQFEMDIAMVTAVADSESENHQLARLRRFVGVMVMVWLLASVYYFFVRPESNLKLQCLIGAIVTSGHYLAVVLRRFPRKHIAYSFLCTSLVITLVCAARANFEFSLPQYSIPITCLFGAQLLGVKTAVRWYALIVVVTFFCYYPRMFEATNLIDWQIFDHMLINLAVSFTVIWLSDQSERLLQDRSTEFANLTGNLAENARLLELAEETAGVGHWRWKLAEEQFEFSDELKRILNCTENQLPSLGLLLNQFNDDDSQSLHEKLLDARQTGESFECDLTLSNENSNVRFVSVRAISERDESGRVTSIFGVVRDDTQLKEATSRLAKKAKDLRKLASFDPLTGLANRFLFRRHLQKIVKSSVQDNRLAALLVLDMDGFKEINDTLGHTVGDLVLKRTARRIRRIVGKENVVARLGGDEFTVILRSPKSEQEVIETGERIVAEILRPMQLENSELHVGASIGASLCPIDSCVPDELFTFADTAMYAAKFEGKDIVIYEASMTEKLVERKRVESRLSGALQREEFQLVFQPQVDLSVNRINGFEALVRWNNAGDAVSPGEFIPLLESTGKIVEVGNWILQEACDQAAIWYREGYHFTMAINISPVQFREDDFTRNVIRIIESANIPPELIDIEITETMLISNIEQTSKVLKELRDFGTKISIDDFGTGYSSLAYLKDFPIDRLKIDRTFIKDFPAHDDGMIATSIIVLGQSLDMEVLAEGVETQEQLDFLKKHMCDSFQGHLFSPPADPAKCLQLLHDRGIPIKPLRQAILKR